MKDGNIKNTIKAALKEKGVSQTEIAKLLGLSAVAVHQVVHGQRKNPRIRKAIALSIGIPVDEIDWPEHKKTPALPPDRYPVEG